MSVFASEGAVVHGVDPRERAAFRDDAGHSAAASRRRRLRVGRYSRRFCHTKDHAAVDA